jgi:entry exclusion lipoprotein TrbK
MIKNTNLNSYTAIALSMMLMITACSKEEPKTQTSGNTVPTQIVKAEGVSDADCELAKLKAIPSKEQREEQAGKCLRRGTFTSSPNKSY